MRLDPLIFLGACYALGSLLLRSLNAKAPALATIGIGAAAFLVVARVAGWDLEPLNVQGKGITRGKVGRTLEKAGRTLQVGSGDRREVRSLPSPDWGPSA